MNEAIRQRSVELGFDDCRFTSAQAPDSVEKFRTWLGEKKQGEMAWLERGAEKRADPQRILPGARSVICVAASYARSDECGVTSVGAPRHPPPVTCCGIVARYARFADYHEVMADRLKSLAEFVNRTGGPQTRSLWYVDTGPILERAFAERAGVGFVGKHTNLISRKLGNWIFLAEILTTLELAPDAPEKNHCGKCSLCLSACPTNAITAPFELDARRCISYLTIELKGSIPVELRPLMGNRIFGCDDCLAVCPWNKFAREGRMMRPYLRAELGQPDLIQLLGLEDAAFKKKFAGTPMLRAKRRGLLRNVCVALGNTGDKSALPALEKAAGDPEPLIAGHARWAIEQITVTPASRLCGPDGEKGNKPI
jgi:epoxyqueuosine reductase